MIQVTWLGLIVAIVVVLLVYDDDDDDDRRPLDSHRRHEEPPRKLPQYHENHTQLLSNNKKLDNDLSMMLKKKKRRQQQSTSSSSQQTRSGFVTLEEVVAYECHFQAVYQNTTWLEGSDTEIKYLDVFDQPRVINVVGFEQSYRDPRETVKQRIIVKRNDTWVERKNDQVTEILPADSLQFLLFGNDSSGIELFFSLHHNDDILSTGKVHVTKMMILEATGKTLFVAAPISNVSLRFLYGGEPVRCLTCNSEGENDTVECLSSDAVLSSNARYYILYCRGPEVPWTAVVSTLNNRIIYRMNNQENSRELYASRPRPVIHELEVKLDATGKHVARVRLHLPTDWPDKTRRQDKCNNRLRLLLRIADEQQDQLVNAEFDFTLMNYFTTVKGYAMVYADVRGSRFQSFDFRYLRFRRRESMQMNDYSRVIAHILYHFECIENTTIGVYGENYGGHMALNLIADNSDEERNTNGDDDKFRCAVAVNPLARWHDYVYPFTVEHTSGVTGALRKKMFKRYYMAALVNRLGERKNFVIHTSRRSNEHRYYTNTLVKMLNYHKVKFEHYQYDDVSVKMCNSRLKIYQQASDFFDRCFVRENQ